MAFFFSFFLKDLLALNPNFISLVIPDTPCHAGAVVDSKEQWADVTAYWDITKPFINEAIEAWSHKAKAMDGSTAKKFKALDMSCLDQVCPPLACPCPCLCGGHYWRGAVVAVGSWFGHG